MLYLRTLFSGCSVARSSRLLWEQEVAGSNPATPTKNGPRDVAQPGSAHAWGAWGRRFKSCHPDKQMPNFDEVRFFCLFENYDDPILFLFFPSTTKIGYIKSLLDKLFS